MESIGTEFTRILAILTVLGNLSVLMLMLLWLFSRPLFLRIIDLIGEYALSLGLFISAASTIGSIIYSEVVGFPACILCWIQRVFMYPQMFLFGLALWRKERTIAPYLFLLSIIGGAVALYQWVKDMFLWYGHTTLPCPAITGLPSCDRLYVQEFGYITIPMIALNAFILLAIITWASMRKKPAEEMR